ncbi:MAG: hypothetical protein AAF752_00940, partial [Bacteroidota bacterium]
RIYFHTDAGGRQLKPMANPPRSLYSRLPRRFCFTETETAPTFLRSTRHRRLRQRLRGARFFVSTPVPM